MMVNTLSGGETAFNALLYKQPDNNLLGYLQHNVQSAIDSTINFGSSFVHNVQNMYNRFNDSSVVNASKALLFKSGSHMNQTVIYPVSYDGFGTANLIMQRYIMAHPYVSSLNERNMCYGYQDTYINNNPYIGAESKEYMDTMTGVLQFDSNDKGYVKHYSYYYSDENETELDIYDKLSVLDTWDNINRLIAKGIDPTDPDEGIL